MTWRELLESGASLADVLDAAAKEAVSVDLDEAAKREAALRDEVQALKADVFERDLRIESMKADIIGAANRIDGLVQCIADVREAVRRV